MHGLGVYVFFLVGGYLITKSWMADPHPLRYAVKRFFRLVPPLAVYVLLAAFVAGPLLTNLSFIEYIFHPFTWRYLLNIFFNIQYPLAGVFETNPYPYVANGSLWVLPVEVAMYILLPVVLSLLRLKKDTRASHIGLMVVTALVCALELCRTLFFPDIAWVVYGIHIGQALKVIPFFFLGSVFTLPEVKKWLNLQAALVLLLVYVCFYFGSAKNEFLLYVVLSYLIFSLALATPARFSRTFEKWEISYGLFLYGFFIQQTVVALLPGTGLVLSQNIYNILCVLLTAPFAYLSFRFVETPCRKLTKRILALPVMNLHKTVLDETPQIRHK